MEIDMPLFIENEAAYEAAIERNIANNRRKTGARKFAALFEDATAIIDFVETRVSDAQVAHWARFGRGMEEASFIDACWAGLQTFGGLTEKQGLAVRSIIAKNAERKAQYRAEALTKVHVGTVGERRDFDLTVRFVTDFETQFGITNVFVMEDAEGNVVVYKGAGSLYNADGQFAVKGDKISVKATVKEHGERDGVKQTIIARPKQKI
ncbi:MAG: hypothetical protein AMJ59_12740 [Gammaproteobacteria bacterium SG8_31]|nr:MAG: hypothetical protein AMJ59_12740 [Gammaproteobacteria bacterium SG8_31]